MTTGALDRCARLTRLFYTAAERPDVLLRNQLQSASGVVDNLVIRPLLDFQKEALTCLVADLMGGYTSEGPHRFADSFLLKAVNRGMFQVAAAEFCNFCFFEGKVQSRLWHKRRAEQLLFSRGTVIF